MPRGAEVAHASFFPLSYHPSKASSLFPVIIPLSTMSTNSQNVATPNTLRRRPVQGAARLVAKSFTGLANLPGLRDSAKTIHDLSVALKVGLLQKPEKG